MSFSTTAPLEEVHGKIESIWGVKRIDVEFVSIFEKLIFNTTNGLFSGMITADGEIQVTDDAFFKDCNVTNACIIKEDLLLCTLNDPEGISKIMTVDVDEETTELIIEKKENVYAFDLEKIPGTGEDVFFIMHSGQGLYLIDPINKKSYNLRYDDNSNFNTCRSVALALIDDENPESGFWMANIDNTNPFAPEIKVYDFDNKFITELQKISQQVKASKE